MSPRRQPAQPPELPGYTVERLLGSGGFADVYLYTQRLPQRQVAIKVLTHEATQGQSREQFAAEANLMAQLSTHSSIVTIYHADTAADGRPYLVMQYCPLPNLAERVKVRPLGVPEVLGIGVRLAGAVETAHRAGIVHRDIKPANVLTTEYGRPALTDFGIAGLTGADESGGVSIPWAPPEAIEGESSGVAGDVYSLAATLYTLLAGRSPFARPGGPNTRLDLTMRIKRDPVPPIGRTDVPASLERLLAAAMAKSPAARPATALDLARALQVVEQELRLAMTDIEVPDTSWLSSATAPADDGSDEGRTVVRAVTEVDPTGATPAPVEEEPHTVLRGVRTWEHDDVTESTRGRADAAAEPDDAAPDRRRPTWRWVAAGVAAAAVVVGGIVVAGQLRGDEEPEPTATSTIGTVVIPDVVPPPVDLSGERVSGERVEFTWSAPEVEGEPSYSWVRTDGGKVGESQPVAEAPLVVESAERVCIELRTITEQGMVSAEPAATCVD
ncbi:serine/threonine-protein kinase [Georgenia phoenicis]|uniref:serine/threonine-protein kinase n=1 Tax=unclassified Georgenia TaxID=2626815 RepID=UPI0039AF6AC4